MTCARLWLASSVASLSIQAISGRELAVVDRIPRIGLALAQVETEGALTHDFIFDVILPPLLFEAALAIHWAELRRDALPVVTLAT